MKFLEKILSEQTMASLKEKLGEELFGKVSEATEDFAIDVAVEKFIPKAKFDEVNTQVKDLKTQLGSRDEQLIKLTESAKGNEELMKQLEEVKKHNEQEKGEFENRLKKTELDYEINLALTNRGVKNIKAFRAVMELDGVNYENGKLVGFDERFENAKKEVPELIVKTKVNKMGEELPDDNVPKIEDKFDQIMLRGKK